MTCHVALQSSHGSVILSDSQGSDDRAEFHGWQKQYAGDGFIIGVAGSGLVLEQLFEWIDTDPASGAPVLDALTDFFRQEVTLAARSDVNVLVAREEGIHTYYPGISIRPPTRPQPFGSIGSGAEFVFRAIRRDNTLGLGSASNSLAHLVTDAFRYMSSSNESLTVDDQYLLGFVKDGKSYIFGERQITLRHAHADLIDQWPQASDCYREIRTRVQTIEGSITEAARRFSFIRGGSLNNQHIVEIVQLNSHVARMFNDLDAYLARCLGWYDSVLGR